MLVVVMTLTAVPLGVTQEFKGLGSLFKGFVTTAKAADYKNIKIDVDILDGASHQSSDQAQLNENGEPNGITLYYIDADGESRLTTLPISENEFKESGTTKSFEFKLDSAASYPTSVYIGKLGLTGSTYDKIDMTIKIYESEENLQEYNLIAESRSYINQSTPDMQSFIDLRYDILPDAAETKWKVELSTNRYDWKHDGQYIKVRYYSDGKICESQSSSFYISPNQFENDNVSYSFTGTSAGYPCEVQLCTMMNKNTVWNANYTCKLSVYDENSQSWVLIADSGLMDGIKSRTYFLSLTAYPEKWIKYSGVIGDNVEWTLSENGVLDITGNGDMSSLSGQKYQPWYNRYSEIKSVRIGEGITGIGKYSFFSCKKIESVDLPNTLTKIEDYAFDDCTALKNIYLPSSLNSVGNLSLQNRNLQSINVDPSNEYYTSDANGALYSKDMSVLYVYPSANGYNEYIVPESVKTIKKNAFIFCSQLNYISIYKSVSEIEDNATDSDFKGVINVDSAFSAACKYAIRNNIDFTVSQEETETAETIALDPEKTSYSAGSSTVLASGIVSLKVEYGFKDEYQPLVSNMQLRVCLPSTDNIVENSIKVNGVSSDYNVDGHYLTIALTDYEGYVNFSVIPYITGDIKSSAQIDYSYEEEHRSEDVGFMNLKTNALTIDIPDEIAGNVLAVNGTASSENEVRIYVDGVEYATCTSTVFGKYSTKITLPTNKASFIIEAQETDADGNVASVKSCTTNTQRKIKYAYMYYRGFKYNLMGTSRPSISWASSYSASFKISFDCNYLIEEVYITTVYNGRTYSLKANYSNSAGAFVASGFSRIVPGVIKIEYKSKNNEYIVDTDADIKKIAEESVSEKMKNAEVEVQKNTINEKSQTGSFEATIQPSGENTPIKYSLTKTKENKPNVTPSELEKNGYTKVKRDDGTSTYVEIHQEEDTGKIKYSFWDFTNDALDVGYKTTLDIDFELFDIAPKSTISQVANIIDFGLDFIELGGKMYNVSKLKKQIMDAPLSNEEKSRRTAELEYIARKYYMFSALKMTSSVVLMDAALIGGAALGPVGAALMVGIGLVNNIFWQFMDNWADQWFQNNVSSLLNVQYRYIIDPSGYVYEAVKDNRLTDVKTTIYYKDEETGEAVLWDASEYEQENPLYTDTEGKYAWDVPVGYWLVKCEKDGYLTAYSDWLPVPPPQLDINIAMVSTQAPIVEYINVDNNGAEICFSQYMDPNTVNDTTIDISCGEKIVSGTWSTVDSQPDANDSEKVYATTYRFEADSELSGTVSVSVNGAANYAGRTLEESFTEDYTVQEAIESFHVPESVVCEYGKNAEIKLSAQPVSAAKGKTVNVSLEDTNIATLNAQSVVFDENGEAVISVKSNLPGSTAITFNVDKTHFSAETELISNMPEDDEEITDISIKALPTKLDYLTGDRIDTDGIVVTATYGDGTEIEMNEGLAFYPSKLINIGETEITVSLGELTDTFIVNVTCNHDYLSEITLPTCTEDGYTTYTCSACGDTYQDDIVTALGHTEVTDPAVAATCTETGLTQGSHCSVCGEVFVAQKVVSALGHTYGEYAVTTEPTCTKTGVETKTCSVCGDKQTRPVAALGHTSVTDPAVDATCTKTGLTEGSHCSVCGEVLTAQKKISALGHTYGEYVVTTEPTCTKAGVETKTCSVCGDKQTRPVAALGHTEVTDPAVAATCTETGLTQGSHCSVCGEVLTAQKEISALGHTYGEYAVTIQPTCTKAGVETKTCSVCGDKQTRPVAALGHTDTDADGNCDNCGEIMEAVKTCSHMCHKGGFSGFIWKLINLFNKLFRTNKTCSCGVNHY